MTYRFVTEREDYSDYASGRVFYNSPGQPAFPVRLVSEIFQRCLAIRRRQGINDPVTLYDPCCGSAYHLTALVHLHWREVRAIFASDIDAEILAVAARNLSLLTAAGLERRRGEIMAMIERYGKQSHAEALESVERFLARLNEWSHSLTAQTFCADATDGAQVAKHLSGQQVDLILSDVPYGQHAQWQQASPTSADQPLLWQMLEAVKPILSATSMVAIAADKSQRVAHEEYRRIERFQVGKRQIVLLQQK
jgi:23S rRNA (guanine2535-N1)-methyltransferase